ncbi:MAG: hypothetical protein HY698_16815 [Deltaproteobacteria bacterium]|nr:hypothetical protein [Deltaproteobacteria bacterium]
MSNARFLAAFGLASLGLVTPAWAQEDPIPSPPAAPPSAEPPAEPASPPVPTPQAEPAPPPVAAQPAPAYPYPPPNYRPAYYTPPPAASAWRSPQRTPNRDGFLIGFSLGPGVLKPNDCDECDGLAGLGLEFHIGGMLTPELGLMLDASAVMHELTDDEVMLYRTRGSVAQVIGAIALQYFATRNLWLKVGLGSASWQIADEKGNTVAENDDGFAVLLGAGVELYQSSSFALDLQLRYANAVYKEVAGKQPKWSNTSFMLGFNWY